MLRKIRKLLREISLSFLIFCLVLVGMGASQPKCNSEDLRARAINAVTSLPSAFRVIAPKLNPLVYTVLDVAASGFRTFALDQTGNNWEKALNYWNTSVKPLVLAQNKDTLTRIISATDILLGQVIIKTPVDSGIGGAEAGETVVEFKFKKSDVEILENLLKEN